MNIAFLGLGLMGSRMGSRLLQAGHALWVWNRTPAAAQPLLDQGAQWLSPADLSRCGVVCLCVADDAAVDAVARQWLGPQGENLCAGQVVVDFSSTTPQLAQRWHQALQARGGHWIDAPVSGGVPGAERGELVVFAGGEAAVIDRLQPLWAPLSQRVTAMGGSGSGQVTKLCNQLIVAANSTLIAEAVHLARQAGVDATRLAPALAGGFADSRPFQMLAPRMASGQFEPVQWRVQTLLKDLSNVLTLAEQLGLSLPVTDQATRLMQAHAAGHARDDLSTLIQAYEKPGPA